MVRKALLCILLLAFTSSAVATGQITTQRMTTVTGVPFDVLHASDERPRHGIVLVHDWFGVSAYYRETIEGLAAAGFYVLAVDLYDGESATTHQDAWRLMSALDQALAAAKVDAAVGQLKSKGLTSSAIFGFSMGSPIALAAAMRHPDIIRATALFYGDTINESERLQSLGGPVLLVVGSKDGNSAETSAAFSQATDQAGKLAEVFIYPGAHHAFAQPLFNQGATYDPVAADVAWRLAVDFLRRRLD